MIANMARDFEFEPHFGSIDSTVVTAISAFLAIHSIQKSLRYYYSDTTTPY